MRPVTSLRSSLVLALLAQVASACAYDWTAASKPLPLPDDTGVAADTTVADIADVAPVDTAPDCSPLRDELENSRAASKRCVSTAGACTKTVTNECGCASTVGDLTSVESGRFVSAVKAFVDAKCKPACGAACGEVKSGFCLVDDAGGTSCAGP